jgi:hypothetical protein
MWELVIMSQLWHVAAGITMYGSTRHTPPLAANPASALDTPPPFVVIDRNRGVSLRENQTGE